MTRAKDSAISAEASLKEVTREAHAAIKDLRAVIREAKEVVIEIEKASQIAVDERIEPILKDEVKRLGEATRKAMDEAVDKVGKEFDRLEAIFLGTDKKSQREGKPSLEEMIKQHPRSATN